MVVVVDRLRTGDEETKRKLRKEESKVRKMLDLFCEKHRIGKAVVQDM